MPKMSVDSICLDPTAVGSEVKEWDCPDHPRPHRYIGAWGEGGTVEIFYPRRQLIFDGLKYPCGWFLTFRNPNRTTAAKYFSLFFSHETGATFKRISGSPSSWPKTKTVSPSDICDAEQLPVAGEDCVSATVIETGVEYSFDAAHAMGWFRWPTSASPVSIEITLESGSIQVFKSEYVLEPTESCTTALFETSGGPCYEFTQDEGGTLQVQLVPSAAVGTIIFRDTGC